EGPLPLPGTHASAATSHLSFVYLSALSGESSLPARPGPSPLKPHSPHSGNGRPPSATTHLSFVYLSALSGESSLPARPGPSPLKPHSPTPETAAAATRETPESIPAPPPSSRSAAAPAPPTHPKTRHTMPEESLPPLSRSHLHPASRSATTT